MNRYKSLDSRQLKFASTPIPIRSVPDHRLRTVRRHSRNWRPLRRERRDSNPVVARQGSMATWQERYGALLRLASVQVRRHLGLRYHPAPGGPDQMGRASGDTVRQPQPTAIPLALVQHPRETRSSRQSRRFQPQLLGAIEQLQQSEQLGIVHRVEPIQHALHRSPHESRRPPNRQAIRPKPDTSLRSFQFQLSHCPIRKATFTVNSTAA